MRAPWVGALVFTHLYYSVPVQVELRRGVGQLPRSGVHALAEEGQDRGVEPIGLGQLAGGAGEVAYKRAAVSTATGGAGPPGSLLRAQ